MIERTMMDIRQFLLVMIIIVTGFVMGFIALGENVTHSAFWVFNSGLFQLDPSFPAERPHEHTGLFGHLLLFEAREGRDGVGSIDRSHSSGALVPTARRAASARGSFAIRKHSARRRPAAAAAAAAAALLRRC